MYIWRAIFSLAAVFSASTFRSTTVRANSSPARTAGVLRHFHIFLEMMGFFGPGFRRRAGLGRSSSANACSPENGPATAGYCCTRVPGDETWCDSSGSFAVPLQRASRNVGQRVRQGTRVASARAQGGQQGCAGGAACAGSRVAEGVGRKGLGPGERLLELLLGSVDALRIPLVLPHRVGPTGPQALASHAA